MMMDMPPYQQQMDPKIWAVVDLSLWRNTLQSSSVAAQLLTIHNQIPFFQIKLPPQVQRFTMQTLHRRKDGKHSFQEETISTKYFNF